MGLFTQLENLTKSLRAVMPAGALGMADVNCRSSTGRVVEYRAGSMGRSKRWSDSGNPQ